MVFHISPSHGWLEVSMKKLEELGIKNEITPYSYQSSDGQTAYLEEDCDAPTFVKALEENGESFEYSEKHHDKNPSFTNGPRF